MKKILIITYYWPPSGGAGVQRWLKFARYFLDFDLHPIVLTVDERFASYPVRDESLQAEIPPAVTVIRTRTKEPFGFYKKVSGKKEIPSGGFASGDSHSFKDALMRFTRGNFFIPDARIGWNKYAFEAASKIILEEKPAAVITSSPPHSTQLIGLKLKKAFGLPWIADLRDPWTDIYYYKKMLHTALAKKKDQQYEKKVLETADKVVVVSPSIKNIFSGKSPLIKEDKIVVIPNGYDEKDFAGRNPSADKIPGFEKEFFVTYTGTMAESYAPYTFFTALGSLIKNNPDSPIRFRFVGSLPKGMFEYLKTLPWSTQIDFIPYSPHDQVIGYMLASSVLYLAIPQSEGNKGILTGKLFEYLAARKPIVGTGPADGDAAAIIDSCQAGKMFEANDGNGMLLHLQGLLDQWKQNKNLTVQSDGYKKYSRKSLTEQFVKLI